MSAKQKWIDDIISSADNMHPASPDAGFYSRLMARFAGTSTQIVHLNTRSIWAMAAGVVLLIGINVISITHFYTQNNPVTQVGQQPAASVIATEYFSYLNNI